MLISVLITFARHGDTHKRAAKKKRDTEIMSATMFCFVFVSLRFIKQRSIEKYKDKLIRIVLFCIFYEGL